MNRFYERRSKPRVSCNYPVIVEGTNGEGNKYRENARLKNLSATGHYMILNRSVPTGHILSTTILLTDAPDPGEDLPKIHAYGTVVRIDSLIDGSYGIAVRYKSYRFV
jgi:hypothetical protein